MNDAEEILQLAHEFGKVAGKQPPKVIGMALLTCLATGIARLAETQEDLEAGLSFVCEDIRTFAQLEFERINQDDPHCRTTRSH